MDTQLSPGTFSEFEQHARRAGVVAITRTVSSTSFNVLDAFMTIGNAKRYAFLFESVEGEERVAQYSFVGADPYMIVRGNGNQTVLEREDGLETLQMPASDYLKQHFRQRTLAEQVDQVPLMGGAVGYLGYNAAQWFEPAAKSAEGTCDDAVFMVCRSLVVFDHRRNRVRLVSVVFPEEADQDRRKLRQLYQDAVKQTQELYDALNERPSSVSGRQAVENSEHEWRSNWSKSDFEDAVNRVKEHILAGDCYQVVLSQRFSRHVTATPIAIYRALRKTNPAPYMYFLKLDSDSIIGASPEMLVRCRGGRIEYRPIAGTRPRGATDEEDQRLTEEMKADSKEIAEHMMLVDLGRNDVGRVAAFGSLRIDELMTVERYSKVQHLVSSLSAQLRANCDRFDALAACFPAGTVTGAPKVKAMQIIRELEPEPRSVYAGAIFYADYAGNLDSCIAIRTIELRNGQASVQAGAGIVADSIPEREYAETVAKAEALRRAIEIAEESEVTLIR